MSDPPNTASPEPPTDVKPPVGNNTAVGSFGDATDTGQSAAASGPAADALQPGQVLDGYRLEKKLGEGGMGTVWQAMHTKLGKTVALKVLPRHLTSNPSLVTRFEREMKAVGLLDHPHIIRAMDAGEVNGTHYLVMEYADGIDFAEIVRRYGPLSSANASELIRQAALGLDHAHRHGLIHRDIKPTNLFLTKSRQVKILDLGLARLQGEEVSLGGHDPTLTRMGQIMGTPDYMAPEQWDDTHTADGRADLYSLGCTLFFLLTARAPFGDEAHRSMKQKFLAHIQEEIPDLRAARRAAAATRGGTPLDEIPDELVAIFRRLLAKRPEDRFQTGGELAQALSATIEGPALSQTMTYAAVERPANSSASTIAAATSNDSSAAKLAEFFQTMPEASPTKNSHTVTGRNPSLVTATSSPRSAKPVWIIAGGIAALLVAVGLWTHLGTRETPTPKTTATQNDSTLDAKPKAKPAGKAVADETPPKTDPPKKVASKTIPPLQFGKPRPIVKPEPLTGLTQRGAPLSLFSTVSRPAAIDGLRSWSIEPATHNGYVTNIVWSPAGDVIATAGDGDFSIRLWDHDGRLLKALYGHENPSICSLSFSHDGSLLVSCDKEASTSERPATLRVWDVASGACLKVVPSRNRIESVSFSPLTSEVAFSDTYHGLLGIATLDRFPPRTRHLSRPIQSNLIWSPDGRLLAGITGHGEVEIFETRNFDLVARLVVPDRSGKDIGIGWYSGSVAWSPDGAKIAAAIAHDQLHVWEAASGRHLTSISTGYSGVVRVSWSSDSRRFLTDGWQGPSWITFDATDGRRLATGEGMGIHSAWNPEETEVAAWDVSGRQLLFYDAADGRLARRGSGLGWNMGDLTSVSADGSTLLFRPHYLTQAIAFDAQTGVRTRKIKVPPPFHQFGDYFAIFSPDGRKIALHEPNQPRPVLIMNFETEELERQLIAENMVANAIAWSKDGRFVAAACQDHHVRSWEIATGELVHDLSGHEGSVTMVEWSPDGTMLASAGADQTVRIWNAAAGDVVRFVRELPEMVKDEFVNFGGRFHRLAWTPDSQELWIGMDLHAARLNLATGRFSRLENFSNGNSIRSLALSPSGKRLLVQEGYDWMFVRDEGAAAPRLLGQYLGSQAFWHSDERRFWGQRHQSQVVTYDTQSNSRGGTLFPFIRGNGNSDHWLCVGLTGHYRGSDGVEEQFVYIALFEDGRQETFSPAAFAEKFGWKNDPEQATLLKLDD